MTCRWSDIKHFRQLGSMTPGHPEYGITPGVETTTGPLGQGFGNGIGMAIAAKHLRARFEGDKSELFDHRVFAIVSDGDLMEGVASEAASIAGHLGLGNLVYHLRRQPRHDRRRHRFVVRRKRVRALRRLRLAYAGRRRCQRSRGAVGSDRKRDRGGLTAPRSSAFASHIGYGSPQSAGHLEGAWPGARRRRGQTDQALLRMARGAGVLRSRPGAQALSRLWRREARASSPTGMRVRALCQGAARARPRSSSRCWRANCRTDGTRSCRSSRLRTRWPRANRPRGPKQAIAEKSLEPVRRRGRPERIDFRRRDGRRRFRAPRLRWDATCTSASASMGCARS